MPRTTKKSLLFIASFALVGSAIILAAHAATPEATIEPELGIIANGAVSMPDAQASGGSYLTFNAPMTGMNHIPDSQLPQGDPTQATTKLLLDAGSVGSKSGDGSGNFRIVCSFSHMSYDDPIAFPGQQGAAHLHTFFGNASTNYASTHASLTDPSTASTCPGGAANRSAYWFPTMMNGSTPVAPSLIGVYYKSEYLPAPTIQDIPVGIKMIAGNKNSLVAQSPFVAFWQCLETGTNGNGLIPSCPVGDQIEMDIKFPQCWDGVNLDSPDHISHVHYVGLPDPKPPGTIGNYGDGCSKEIGHSVPIPELTVKAFWIVPAGGVANLRLSSDLPGAVAGSSGHADYIEGWDRTIEARFAQHCIREGGDDSNSLCDGGILVAPNQFIFH